MTRGPGHLGQPGFRWADYVDWVVATCGSLAAAADRLAAHRGYKDDAGSIERALRRLRKRGSLDGGTWGARALALFGLPDAIHQRVRWLGQYHSRFTDLPASLGADLLRAWSQPPTTESRDGRVWIALGHASLATRARDHVAAIAHLDRARADLVGAPAVARIEALFVRAYVASREDQVLARSLVDEVPALLETVTTPHDRACLHARYIDHVAYELNRDGKHADAEALYREIPDDAPAFARARKCSGLAYARWKQGDQRQAIEMAHLAAEHAGDGGHVRARAMALALLARITDDSDTRRRAIEMSRLLEDETLLARLHVTR